MRSSWLGVVAVIALLTGCAGGGGAAPDARPVAELVASGVDCTVLPRGFDAPEQPEPPAPPLAGSVPQGFVPVEASVCQESFGDTVDAGGSLYSALRHDRHVGDLKPLLAALAEPDDAIGGVCTADMQIVPDLWLVDENGTAMRAAWPRDQCGKTKPAAHDALAGIPIAETILVGNTPIDREVHETGCGVSGSVPVAPQDVALATEPFVPGATTAPSIPLPPPAIPAGTELPHACLYRVLPAPPDDAITVPGLDQPLAVMRFAHDGERLRTVDLTAEQGAALLAAASGEILTAPCSAEPTLFATFPPRRTDDGLVADPALIAELDGCRRLFAGFQTAYAVPGEVADALLAEAVAAG